MMVTLEIGVEFRMELNIIVARQWMEYSWVCVDNAVKNILRDKNKCVKAVMSE